MSLSLREKIDAIFSRLGASRGAMPIIAEMKADILAAIEAERPAIEAAERERLAKLAEKRAASPGTLLMFTFHVTWRQVADFIRSQGDTGQS
jgi:hypothetical protein